MPIEVEVLGAALVAGAPAGEELERLCQELERLCEELTHLCVLATAAVGVSEGHLAIEFVDAARISQLNAEYRGKRGPTDVLSFPIDEMAPPDGSPRELGDIVICPEHTADLSAAVVHGALHLVGFDHERDDGEMLALQAEILAEASR